MFLKYHHSKPNPAEVTGELLKVCKVIREKSFNATTLRMKTGLGGGLKSSMGTKTSEYRRSSDNWKTKY